MFLTVTLNPALDKTLRVRENAAQVTVRATEAIDLAGGKGVNVSRALKALGAETRALMPLGGRSGEHLADLAGAEGIQIAAVPVAGRTRTAVTVHEASSGQYWHYLEPGPELSEGEMARLKGVFLAALDGCRYVALSGSLPSPAAAPLVAWIIQAAQQRGRRAALDSFGPALRDALEAGPWLAKPNVDEWRLATGETLGSAADRWDALKRMEEWGIAFAVLSDGAEGAWARIGGERFRLAPIPVTEVSDLGGGDSMVAGILWAADQGLSASECLAWGAACGAANAEVWNPGEINLNRVQELLALARVERL